MKRQTGLSAIALAITGLLTTLLPATPLASAQDVIPTTQPRVPAPPPRQPTPRPAPAPAATEVAPRRPRSVDTAPPASSRRVMRFPANPVTLFDESVVSALQVDASPGYGAISFGAFARTPERRYVFLSDLQRINLSIEQLCAGYFDTKPVLTVASQSVGRVRLLTQGSMDTVLLVRFANGGWACDDDSGDGLNASLDVNLSSFDGPLTIFLGYYENVLTAAPVEIVVDPNPSMFSQ